MKIIRETLLEIEKLTRFIGYILGISGLFMWTILTIMCFEAINNINNRLAPDSLKIRNLRDLGMIDFAHHMVNFIYLSFMGIIIASIFILVATRKFKELNQLIKENKKL